MKRNLTEIVLAAILLSFAYRIAAAQGRPRRPVTIHFQQSPITRAQFSSDEMPQGAPAEVGSNSSLQESQTAFSPTSNGMSFPTVAGSTGVSSEMSQRPDVQQMQNPSGAFNMTHGGVTQGQYYSNNNYFGSQYNNWSNLQTLPRNLDSSQTFNRSQPPVYSGAQFAPNTYFGNANGQWSNLNSGYAVPNYLGGYIYQP